MQKKADKQLRELIERGRKIVESLRVRTAAFENSEMEVPKKITALELVGSHLKMAVDKVMEQINKDISGGRGIKQLNEVAIQEIELLNEFNNKILDGLCQLIDDESLKKYIESTVFGKESFYHDSCLKPPAGLPDSQLLKLACQVVSKRIDWLREEIREQEDEIKKIREFNELISLGADVKLATRIRSFREQTANLKFD